MFLGFLLTVAALAFMIIWTLLQIKRVDRTIEQVDRALNNNPPPEKK